MAKTPPPTTQPKQSTTIRKLPRLAKGTKILKRPLLHPAIASSRTGASVPKIIYISSSSPFISSVKRVRKYLREIDKRATASRGGGFPPTSDKLGAAAGKKVQAAGSVKTRVGKKGRGGAEEGGAAEEEVLIKATGKAIEKALRLALFFQGQEDCRVQLRTGSVGAVDDLSVVSDGGRGGAAGVRAEKVGRSKEDQQQERERTGGGDGVGDAAGDDEDGDHDVEMEDEAQEIPEAEETRVRKTSMLEVGVSLR